MSAVKQFSCHRLGLFIKSDLVMNYSKIFTCILAVFVVLFLYGVISSDAFYMGNFHIGTFALVLIFGGIWLSSRSFTDLHDQERKQSFLLLPASNLEKLLGRLLLTTVGYVIGTILMFYIVSLLVAGFHWLVFGEASAIFQPICRDIIDYLDVYMFFQSIYFLGAIYFKSNHFSKTSLCLCGLGLAFFLMAFFVFFIFLDANFFDGWKMLGVYAATIRWFYIFMIPPCAWFIAYLCLCESEI